MVDTFTEKDFDILEQQINQKKVYRLADVKDRIEKVAFDVVRFKDSDNLEHLWQVQSTDDGDVLVAMYDEDEAQLESHGHWQAIADRESNVNVFYKGDVITRFATAKMGIPASEAGIVCRYLPSKLASEKDFVASMLSELPIAERKALLNKYPELKG